MKLSLTETKLLHTIDSPADLKKMTLPQLEELCQEIRTFLIDKVTRSGGHLSSNLGIVELTVALHYVFNTPQDDIIWDVGHQSYVHKILTGRKSGFDRLRQKGGLSGFPSPQESEHDTIHAGHSSTSLSIAAGISRGKVIRQDSSATIAMIGDGAFTAGLVFEALNNISHHKLPVIIILNDNGMSISENVGGLSNYLNHMRTSGAYVKFKKKLESLVGRIPGFGNSVKKALYNFKESIKDTFLPGRFFHDIGLDYYGPCDGHNLAELISLFELASKHQLPLILHIMTTKGKGYEQAEVDPCAYHGVSGVAVSEDDSIPVCKTGISYSSLLGISLMDQAKKHKDIIAITAAMTTGTGLADFARTYPERFMDVGIAEQHAVDFACGLAIQGFKPVVAIYSTFIQRAFDMLIHDAALAGLHIVFCLDRAGLVPNDGPTHQGVFDISFLRLIPGFTILLPATLNEFHLMMDAALHKLKGPVAIRYPKDIAISIEEYDLDLPAIMSGQSVIAAPGQDVILVSTGTLLSTAFSVRKKLEDDNIHVEILNLRFAKPIHNRVIDYLTKDGRPVLLIEEGVYNGGVAQYLENEILRKNPEKKVDSITVSDVFPGMDSRDSLLSFFGLTVNKISVRIKNLLIERKNPAFTERG